MNSILNVLKERLHGIWRYRWHAVAAAWIFAVIGWIAVMYVPETHEARARVLVDGVSTMRPLLEGISAGDSVEERLALVQQAMLGQKLLEKVVRRSQLGAGVTDQDEINRLAWRLKRDIRVGPDNPLPGTTEPPPNIYLITYRGRSYEESMSVVRTLVDVFVEDSVSGSREGSQIAQGFLQNQINEYAQRLSEAEKRLAEFKRNNVGVIPGERGDYFGRLQDEIDQLRKARSDLAVAVSRRDEILRQMRGEEPVRRGAGAGRVAAPGAAVPLGSTAEMLEEAEAKLAELSLRFTDKHPDIIALKETIADLRKRQEEEMLALRRGELSASTASGLSRNPIYQSMRLALNEAEVEVAALRRDVNSRELRIQELQSLLEKAPQAEAEYATLMRDYEVTKGQYQALLERLERARVSGDAIETQFVRFELIDPPSADFNPTPPTREHLFALVALGAALLGALFAYVMHQLRPVVNTAASLREITGLPVLGSITLALSGPQLAKRRSEAMGLAVSWAGLIVATALAWIFEERLASLFQAYAG